MPAAVHGRNRATKVDSGCSVRPAGEVRVQPPVEVSVMSVRSARSLRPPGSSGCSTASRRVPILRRSPRADSVETFALSRVARDVHHQVADSWSRETSGYIHACSGCSVAALRGLLVPRSRAGCRGPAVVAGKRRNRAGVVASLLRATADTRQRCRGETRYRALSEAHASPRAWGERVRRAACEMMVASGG